MDLKVPVGWGEKMASIKRIDIADETPTPCDFGRKLL